MDTKYNGWTNRETWLVNLWFGDSFQSEKDDGFEITADYIEDIVYHYVQEHTKDNGFINDMLYIDSINWQELAEHYNTED